jgi:UDP-N-acetylmuramate: L-alanyl-gamma-D-glutamyl-meso-diaminopimelate ligase
VKVHLIGIGGTGMGALAGLLVEAGHEVRGSDGPLYPPMSTLLDALGVPIFEGFRPGNLDWQPDRVVVGNICRRDHVEATAAAARGLKLSSFPALLSELFLAERHAVVVAGTHGKTTTTSLVAHLLAATGQAPGFLVGGIPVNFSRSFAVGRRPYFVVEGDEYDTAFFDKRPKFVHYRPRSVILTSVEFDHADIYPTMADVERAFAMLIEHVPEDGQILVWAGAEVGRRLCRDAVCPVQTYGVGVDADWRADVVGVAPAGVARPAQTLLVRHRDVEVGRFGVPLAGRHNAQNALGALSLALELGVGAAPLVEAMASFAGVRRRQEVRGVAAGVTVVDDFAHHPTAIAETVAALRALHGGRVIAVFEPRSATSRRSVFQREFAVALGTADAVLLAALHAPEGIPEAERLDPRRVVADVQAAGTPAFYFERVEEIVEQLVELCRAGDTVLVMSSGGFGGLIDSLLAALRHG